MKIRTTYRIMKWFDEFQWDQDETKMLELYLKLIEEEVDELDEAIKNKDLVEILDAIWDIVFVANWYMFFGWEWRKWMETVQFAFNTLSLTNLEQNKYADFLDELMNVICDSNFTKTKDKQTEWEKVGKIIKWNNFQEPKIVELIEKYSLKLNDE